MARDRSGSETSRDAAARVARFQRVFDHVLYILSKRGPNHYKIIIYKLYSLTTRELGCKRNNTHDSNLNGSRYDTIILHCIRVLLMRVFHFRRLK